MLSNLTSSEMDVVRRALEAASNGPFFPDWEFQTLFGIDRKELRDAVRRFPALAGETDELAVDSALANLLGYPHGHSLEPFDLSSNALRETLEALRRLAQ